MQVLATPSVTTPKVTGVGGLMAAPAEKGQPAVWVNGMLGQRKGTDVEGGRELPTHTVSHTHQPGPSQPSSSTLGWAGHGSPASETDMNKTSQLRWRAIWGCYRHHLSPFHDPVDS